MKRRVVVTGMGLVSSLGHCWEDLRQAFITGRTGTKMMPDWAVYQGLETQLAAPVTDFVTPAELPRKSLRTMSRVSLMSVSASLDALRQAGLLDHPILQDGRTGVAYGSSTGGCDGVGEVASMRFYNNIKTISSTSYLKMMSHTTTVNIALHFKLHGRIIPTSTACTSGSLAIGYAYEAIQSGKQTVMIAGGAEELDPTIAGVFDVLYATSKRNSEPSLTPAPFDRLRDGLVVGEGAATLILEDYDFARSRGATILAEVVGFGTNTDGSHATQPSAATMLGAARLALADAGLAPADIGYLNAHATATELGDIAEAQASRELFGARCPVSSSKGHFGHTLGAAGSLESLLAIHFMNHDFYAPTANLKEVDERCAGLDHIIGAPRRFHADHVMNNNFAFGGINTSLIFRRTL